MTDLTGLTDGELTARMAETSTELWRRRTIADIPRRITAALTDADEAGISDVDGLISDARATAAARMKRPDRPSKGRTR